MNRIGLNGIELLSMLMEAKWIRLHIHLLSHIRKLLCNSYILENGAFQHLIQIICIISSGQGAKGSANAPQ